MVAIFYYHPDRRTEYKKEFTDVKEAYKFYNNLKHSKYRYIVSYICDTDYELKVMERIYKL